MPKIEIDDAMDYLRSGGLGETIGLTQMAAEMGAPKVQIDTDMAMALLMLADEALKARAARKN